MRVPIIDPRAVPLDPGVQPALPALAQHRLTPQALRRQFERLHASELGDWRPEFTADGIAVQGAALKPAAVLIPLVDRGDRLGLLLTVRSAQLTHHSGQIAFPGGRSDDDDPTPAATALREAHEEIGLAGDVVDVLGQLPRYATGTGYAITPVVGLIGTDLALEHLRPEPAEVAEVFEVPLPWLMDPANHRRHQFQWRDDEGQEGVRYFFSMPWRPPVEAPPEYFIWGATAAMLRNLYRFLAAE